MGTFVEYRMGVGPSPEIRSWGFKGPGRLEEPCVCGGAIVADEDSWDAVAAAVLAHNRGTGHVAWRLGLVP